MSELTGRGGPGRGQGAKKGQHRVHVKELRDAIEKGVGKPFQQIQMEVFLKLFNDFHNNENTKEFLIFNENMCKRILEQPTQEVEITNATDNLSDEELRERVKSLMTQTKAFVDGTDTPQP